MIMIMMFGRGGPQCAVEGSEPTVPHADEGIASRPVDAGQDDAHGEHN